MKQLRNNLLNIFIILYRRYKELIKESKLNRFKINDI